MNGILIAHNVVPGARMKIHHTSHQPQSTADAEDAILGHTANFRRVVESAGLSAVRGSPKFRPLSAADLCAIAALTITAKPGTPWQPRSSSHKQASRSAGGEIECQSAKIIYDDGEVAAGLFPFALSSSNSWSELCRIILYLELEASPLTLQQWASEGLCPIIGGILRQQRTTQPRFPIFLPFHQPNISFGARMQQYGLLGLSGWACVDETQLARHALLTRQNAPREIGVVTRERLAPSTMGPSFAALRVSKALAALESARLANSNAALCVARRAKLVGEGILLLHFALTRAPLPPL